MRVKDIKIGGRYWCNVSSRRVEVEVLSDTGRNGRRFEVKRVDNGKILGLRAATALHGSRGGDWGGAFGDDSRRGGVLGYKDEAPHHDCGDDHCPGVKF